MNIGKPADPQPASALLDGDDLVGVALLSPLGSGNSLADQLFNLALDAGLRSKGIERAESAGLFRAHFIVWTMSTRDRNSLLRAIEQVLKEARLWELCQVAFFDKAEGYWRTIHPYGAAPFDRFLSQANIDAAKQEAAAEEAMIRAVVAALKSPVQAKQGETQ